VGRYFAVRQRDAHSWVEVYFPGAGWLTFDPSPRAAFEAQTFSASGRISQYFDALRMRWSRYVVDYNVGDQALVAMEFRRQTAAFRGRLAIFWESWSWKIRRNLRTAWRNHGYAALAVGALVAVLLVVFRRTRPGEIAAAWLLRARLRRTPVVFYDRMLRLLARHGYPRPPESTAREFVESLAGRPQIREPAAELTALYEQVRFGGQPLTLVEGTRAAALLRRLETVSR
jgi:sensor c-di-GMP phosphodiesterase-like protein